MTTKVVKNSNRGAKPGEKRGGRKKGTPNKLTGQVKDMVLDALSEAGGTGYLVGQAKQNPVAFMALVGKVIPLQVSGDVNSAITIKIVRFSEDEDNAD